ncbi:MAG: glycogen/starch/alpha-glucan phosphorylase [Rhodocyclaceae bacterium]|nr:glycogen/starch/alpha-glucan phosphorylase [Rhodocyclaceae bacterium]
MKDHQLSPTSLQAQFAALLDGHLNQRSDPDSAEAWMRAAAVACREVLAVRWAQTQQQDKVRTGQPRVHYLSMEFLMGRALSNALAALGLNGVMAELSRKAGVDLPALLEAEPDAALGNGGLGRLAACFLDAFANLGLPSFGYGLRYENGMFAQRVQEGRQIEVPDNWLVNGNAWEHLRHEIHYSIGFGGLVTGGAGGRQWSPAEQVIARAYDFVVPGHNTARVSTLRQWKAEAGETLDFGLFCRGEHVASAVHRLATERINWVLYPDDSTDAGRELRLRQEYFLVSASVQDMIARHLKEGRAISDFAKANVIHLNDTHPALAPVELVRLLLDEYGFAWDDAWQVVGNAVSYTNHTLMPEALETWPVQLFQRLLPRHLEIIYDINDHFLAAVRAKFPGDESMVRRVSLIEETGERRIRMASLSIVASHKVNGVSALHSALMVSTIFADYSRIWPDRFVNVTNGVTPRRWLEQANPSLGGWLDKQIGHGWRSDLTALASLNEVAGQTAMGKELQSIKFANKVNLAGYIRREMGITVDPSSLFDVQVKRIHEYKRQLLNVLHVIARYQAILDAPEAEWTPRTVIFAGKAASAYHAAKLTIQLIHDVARRVNSDARIRGRLKVIFLPNYSVSLAEKIIPAADLSEQISTAGTEASGTGNMKFALNGALTIGTWDGANIEMAEAMGVNNMFVFGLRADAVEALRKVGYDPRLYVEQNRQLQKVIEAISAGEFSPGEPQRYRELVANLLNRDHYMLMADFADYVATQEMVDALYISPDMWATRAVRNIAAMGEFSTDRTIREYVVQVWSQQRGQVV